MYKRQVVKLEANEDANKLVSIDFWANEFDLLVYLLEAWVPAFVLAKMMHAL